MPETVKVHLENALTWKGKNYAPGINDLPADAAAYAKRRRFVVGDSGEASATEGAAGGDPGASSQIGEDGYPADFPGRKALVKLAKTYDEVISMSRDDLIKLNGIAEKTADEILAYRKE